MKAKRSRRRSKDYREVVIPFRPRRAQLELLGQWNRFNSWLCHRRLGKTVCLVNQTVRKALECELPMPRYYLFGVTFGAVKRNMWDYLQYYTMPLNPKINQAELRVDLPNGARIQLASAEKPDTWRGIYAMGVGLDEPQLMPTRLWSQVLRPALADHKGWAVFIGTPGPRHGLFYDVHTDAANYDDWTAVTLPNSYTHILPPEEVRAMARTMTKGELDAEIECIWGTVMRGAVYGEKMSQLERDGQVTRVEYDPAALVYLACDWGVKDSTAIWFIQFDGERHRFIDYYEVDNKSIDEIIADLYALKEERGYRYGTVAIPHDSTRRVIETKYTVRGILQANGFKTHLVEMPKPGMLVEQTNIVRGKLRLCWFDAERCKFGVEALRSYRYDYDEKRTVLRKTILHDWSSHGADALRYWFLASIGVYSALGEDDDIDYSQLDKSAIRR